MVENPPTNAGDMGSIPGPGRCHVSWGWGATKPMCHNQRAAHMPQLKKSALSNRDTAQPGDK